MQGPADVLNGIDVVTFAANGDVIGGNALPVDRDLGCQPASLGRVVSLALGLVGLELRLNNDALVLGVALGRHLCAAKQLLVPVLQVPGVVGRQGVEFNVLAIHLDHGGVGYPIRQAQCCVLDCVLLNGAL